MQDDFSELREELPGSDVTPLPGVDEGADLRRQWYEEQLDRVRQDRSERKAYATRIFLLVCLWLAAVLTLVALQGFLGQRGRFSLSGGVLIAIATTTTASVTALLVVVVRYLFPAPRTRPAGRRARSGRAR